LAVVLDALSFIVSNVRRLIRKLPALGDRHILLSINASTR
jgi:hypothetical protein